MQVTDFIDPSQYTDRHSTTSQRFILTGGPGVGKTTLIKEFNKEGITVVFEAAAAIIKEELDRGIEAPWADPTFNDRIVARQITHQDEHLKTISEVFFDRSPVDALSYSLLFNEIPSENIVETVKNILQEGYYNKVVFLIENLGFCEQTEIRAEALDETIKIEKWIKKVYKKLGFQIVKIPKASVDERIQMIKNQLDGSNKI
jgi:predicted ATPase